MLKSLPVAWPALLAVGLSAGCTGGGNPATYPVTGTITVGNQPLADAQVTFMAPGAPRAAIGKTDAQGKYELTTFAPNDGAIAGTHTVTIANPAKAAPVIDPSNPSAGYGQMMGQASTGQKGPEGLVPVKYSSPTTSDLKAEVKPGKNEFNFDLK